MSYLSMYQVKGWARVDFTAGGVSITPAVLLLSENIVHKAF